ncbi:MAG: Single-stranded-DNA-specific exonuclease RecJ [candidate division WS6 bacterium GW2011_GWF1_35_23]|uniref:Single-stranded-DNA-specific exonuclease RecJ n=1 Tax=candidate division WS6 bacterium GW2011_GWF1_35_23 TaxID=1619097 RepID=A0A0G0C9D9_9BACT|nr:MAG: Single-stranded-DNA-specific exonuclease RecJ [candidate division WS6 bacterium GW2011_GWF1_35_23]
MSLVSKSNWLIPENKQEDLVETILENRGIKNKEEHLEPLLENIPPFKKLFGVSKAAKKIIKYAKEDKKIVIHGDFDCDGICASALLWEFLFREAAKVLGKKVDVVPYIPSRIDQGYGLTESSIKDAQELGCDLLITVDCGVRDKELINKHSKDLDFVITDHHQPPEDISENLDYILVHQMYPGKEYPNKEICGTAVAYLLVQALREELEMEEDREYGLDLVALSTVTDMMPLLDVNRIFVKYGLEQISKGQRLGLNALILRSGILPKDINSYHLGYVIGPRINAAGRIGSPMEAVKLLVSSDEKKCTEIANELNSINFERQKLTTEILDIAKEDVDLENKLLFVQGENWHEGIIGLVAGKLQEQFYRPVIVTTKNDGVIKGSARSIKGFNITKTLEKLDKYLERYGGHELAAGFTAKEKSMDEFVKKITEYANKKITEKDLQRDIKIDLLVDTEDIDNELINNLKKLEPFGYGNPKPIICLKELVVVRKNIMGQEKNHMRLTVKGNGVDLLTLVLFNCNEDTQDINENDSIDVIGYPDINVKYTIYGKGMEIY